MREIKNDIKNAKTAVSPGDINEILNYYPGWSIRNGNLVFAAFFLLVLATSFIIPFPQVTTVAAKFYSEGNSDTSHASLVAREADGMFIQNRSVTVAFADFPDDKFGRLQATILFRHSVIRDSLTVGVFLPEGYLTDKHKRIAPHEFSEVIIYQQNDQKLSGYLWSQFQRLFKR